MSIVMLTAMLASEHRGGHCNDLLLPGRLDRSSAEDSNLVSVWQTSLPATCRLFIFLTRGSTFNPFLMHESVLRFQCAPLAAQKHRKQRGRGDVAGGGGALPGAGSCRVCSAAQGASTCGYILQQAQGCPACGLRWQ